MITAGIKLGIKIGIAAGVGAITVVGGYFIYKKVKNVKKNNHSDSEIIVDVDDISEEDFVEEGIDVDDVEYENSNIREYVCYLVKNGISSDEAVSVAETIDNIRIELPDQYSSVKEKMDVIMNSEFDIDKCHEFDKENFRFLYSNIDIGDLVKKKGIEIVALGAEHQEAMMTLITAISDLQANNDDSALEIVYHIYNLLKDMNLEDINENTFNESFKKFVDTATVNTASEEIAEESSEDETETVNPEP